jgi:hypothetical protein
MAEGKTQIAMVRPTEDKSVGAQTLRILEKKYRAYPEAEIIPYARNTSFVELAENVVPDRDGPYANPLYLFTSRHSTTIGVRTLARKTKEFLEKKREEQDMDILSVSAGMDEDRLMVVALVRVYGKKPKFAELSGYLGEKKESGRGKGSGPRLLIPPGSYRKVTEEEREEHGEALRKQAYEKLARCGRVGARLDDGGIPRRQHIHERIDRQKEGVIPRAQNQDVATGSGQAITLCRKLRQRGFDRARLRPFFEVLYLTADFIKRHTHFAHIPLKIALTEVLFEGGEDFPLTGANTRLQGF